MKIKLLLSILALLQISTCAFAGLHRSHNDPRRIQSAEDTRADMRDWMYFKHAEAIDWWVKTINTRIAKEAKNLSASLCIDVTVADLEVRGYLVEEYTAKGYKAELIPGWNKIKDVPDGKDYLGLSW